MALSRTNRGNATLNYVNQTTNTITSASFSPAAGALLLVLFGEFTNDTTPSLVVTSSFTGQGAWTVDYLAANDGGNWNASGIAWSICGGSPGSGTITCTRRAGSFSDGMFGEFIEITGQDANTPASNNAGNVGSGVTSLALTLGTSPAASSMLFACCMDDNSFNNVVVPSGWTALANNSADAGMTAYTQNAEILASGSTTSTFTNLNNYRCSGVVIEIVAGVSSGTRRLWGGIPFANGVKTKGRWV